MAKKCSACGRFASVAEGVACSKCTGYYHRDCVKIPSDATVAPGWFCPGCKVQTPRKDNTETPVRGEKADYTCTSRQDSLACGTCAELLKEMKLINKNLLLLKNDFNTMKEDVSVLRCTMESFGGRLDCMETRVASLEKNYADLQTGQDGLKGPEVGGLLSTIEDLKIQLNDREQEAFCNDFEITGIPEEQGENAAHLISRIAEKLGVGYDERDLVMAERTGMRRAATDGESSKSPRPRPLVVRVARRQLRDAFLQAARVRRGATTEGLGLVTAPTRFYINERLSKHNKMIFFKAREEAHSHGWKYVWTRGGRVFVRRDTGKASFRVRSEQDLSKVFGGESRGVAT